MSRRDRAVVAVLSVLVVALVVVAGLPQAAAGPDPEIDGDPSPAASLPAAAVYREGIVGRAASVTPLTARSRAELALVGLVFSGLVRLGPGDSLQPDLAASWSVDETGRTWTFRIRDDARWHDGTPVTAADVVFTARALHGAQTPGPAAASWAEVTAAAIGPKTVTLTTETPLGGFLAAALQPLLPAHLLADVPLADLATDPFARAPVGTGPFVLTELDARHAVLVPAAWAEPPPPETGTPLPTDALATPGPVATPRRAVPYLDGIELRFFDDATGLVRAFRAGELDGAAELSGGDATALAADGTTTLLRYPTTTLSTVVLNLRPTHPELRSAAVRRALLGALDRDALVADALGGAGRRADAMVPPDSWAFDGKAAAPVPFDLAAARSALVRAGWKRLDAGLAAPGASRPYALELLAVPAEVNPGAHALATGVAKAWRRLGLEVDLVEVPAADLASRLASGAFAAAVVDVAFGAEPDLYPLLASTQVRAPGTNVAGYQDRALDVLLEAARKPGTLEARKAAWASLLGALAEREPLLPLAWRDDVVVQRGVAGPVPRLLSDPGDRYWDVLAWRLAADR